MKLSATAGLVGFFLALCGVEPAVVPASQPAGAGQGDPPSVDARLERITAAVQMRDPNRVIVSGEPTVLAQVFLNSAPSFRNSISGWRNSFPYWVNTGRFNNSGIHFLNNVPSFRNYSSGWRNNAINGWPNGWPNASNFRNGGFANGGGFRNGGSFLNR